MLRYRLPIWRLYSFLRWQTETVQQGSAKQSDSRMSLSLSLTLRYNHRLSHVATIFSVFPFISLLERVAKMASDNNIGALALTRCLFLVITYYPDWKLLKFSASSIINDSYLWISETIMVLFGFKWNLILLKKYMPIADMQNFILIEFNNWFQKKIVPA